MPKTSGCYHIAHLHLELVDMLPFCSHLRVLQFYRESIQGCNYHSTLLCDDQYNLPVSNTLLCDDQYNLPVSNTLHYADVQYTHIVVSNVPVLTLQPDTNTILLFCLISCSNHA